MKRKANTFNITLSSLKGKTKESPNQNPPTIQNLVKINTMISNYREQEIKNPQITHIA